jgi:hypothetical protein
VKLEIKRGFPPHKEKWSTDIVGARVKPQIESHNEIV